MSKISYHQAVTWLDACQQFGMKPGLDRMNVLMDRLGHPEKELSVIHVAGTNGKGSVCRYLSSILYKEGYQVGLFTSPHIESVRERFHLNEKMISEKEFTELIEVVKKTLENMDSKKDHPTYFEICTALAFLFFQKKKVDYSIIEVGLGGKYDATNIITPVLSIITNIGLDHQHILGKYPEEIALEKAGIIKEGIPVVTAAEGKALKVIKETANRYHARFVVVTPDSSEICEQALDHQIIKVHGLLGEYLLTTHEIGRYQKQNLSIAIHTIEMLQMFGVFISAESIQNGVTEMVHQGRMKIMHIDPLVMIDGAHNPDGMAALKKSIISLFQNKHIICIFGVLKEKDIIEMATLIQGFCDKIILTRPMSNRAADPEKLREVFESFFSSESIVIGHDVNDAIQKAFHLAKKDDIILITGSLYLLNDVFSFFRK